MRRCVTHYACDCILEQLRLLDAVAAAARTIIRRAEDAGAGPLDHTPLSKALHALDEQENDGR